MLRILIAAIAALTLSACAETAATSTPRAAMGSGIGSGMMKSQDGGKMGGMADMCAKMMAEKDAGKGGPMADEKKAAMMGDMKGCADMCAKMMAEKSAAKGDPMGNKKMAAMMDNMKGCKMMSGAGGQKSGAPQMAPGKPSDSGEHSEHHPPK